MDHTVPPETAGQVDHARETEVAREIWEATLIASQEWSRRRRDRTEKLIAKMHSKREES